MRSAGRILGFMLVLAGIVLTPSADAYYGNGLEADGADLVSADYDRLEQGDDSTVFAAISADGEYVVIQTRARNFFADDDPDPPGRYRAGGVFRFNLETRELEKVADGDLFRESDNGFVRRGASSPSVSADGRYIAFATAEQLVPVDTNDYVDVYVRDMNIEPGQPGAFDLVSARDGGDAPANYGPPAFPFPGSNAGADVSRGVALSADGQRVVFRTDTASDLPAAGGTTVEPGQIFVRDRATNQTTLITREMVGGVPAGGGLNAAISGDGSTVGWSGSNAPTQTPLLPGENDDPSFVYYLWRRVPTAALPNPDTRRITGLADPDDPACPPGQQTFFDETSTGPCYGPLTDQESVRTSIVIQTPAMSADGNTVAFLTGSGARPVISSGAGLDLYVTRMDPGQTRKQATVELTRDPAFQDPAASPPIDTIAMSASGRYVAMATSRTSFVLPALRLATNPRANPGVRELYVVDLQTRTIDRVARSASGGDIDGDVQNGITISADGSELAFTAFAGNLFFGDANQRPDAFVATRQPDPDAPPTPSEDDGKPSGEIVEVPKLKGSSKSRRHGAVDVTVDAPAAGDLKVVGTANAGHPKKRRNLAVASAHADAAGPVTVRLQVVRRYRRELAKRARIKGRAQLSFIPAIGGDRISGNTKLVFRR